VSNFIFLFFSVFFCWEEREGVVGFQLRERKWLLGKIPATKTVDFYVKRFHMMREITVRCLFTLKTPKTTDLSLGRIFVSGGFQVLEWFISFLVIMDWFNNVSRVFFKCFRSKMRF